MNDESTTRDPVVVIMAKQPVAGRTKTRLSPPLSPTAAAALSEALLSDTIRLVTSVRGVRVAVAITSVDPDWRPAAPAGTLILAVEGADIGLCISRAIRQLFDRGHLHVIVVDSDSPTLPATYIEQAETLLGRHDLVVGPSEDGGYYLIGLRQPQPELFGDIAWSTSRVTAQTLDRAATLGLSVAVLPAWYDIDTAADLARLRTELSGLPPAALVWTRQFLDGCPPTAVSALATGPFQCAGADTRLEEGRR